MSYNIITKEEKLCIHKYLTKCSSNSQPPGFADFLRGTIALYYFSQNYGYKLFMDGEHPLYKFLKPNKNIIYSNYKTEEFIRAPTYEDIYLKLNNVFKSGRSFCVITNSFYYLQNEKLINFGPILKDCSDYLKDILSPSIEVENNLENIFRNIYKIDMNSSFKAIHLRFGDRYIHQNIYNDSLYNKYYNKIYNLVNKNKNEKYILISDSSEIAKKLKTNIPEIFYWDNSKVHLGDLINAQGSSILDTIMDFLILSKSTEIISNGSGFSTVNSVIYNIKYTIF